jgi:hypothetical protein
MEDRTPEHTPVSASEPGSAFRATPPRTPAGIPTPPAPPPPNRMGVAAFVAALLGLSCVPFAGSIAGLVLGIVAVRREPRGFAIAAIVLSAAGTCLIFPILLGLLLPALGAARNAARSVRTEIALLEVAARAREFESDYGRLPADIVECYGSELPPFDGWGTPLRLRLFGGDLYAESAGDDGLWDTGDDVVERVAVDGEFVDDFEHGMRDVHGEGTGGDDESDHASDARDGMEADGDEAPVEGATSD